MTVSNVSEAFTILNDVTSNTWYLGVNWIIAPIILLLALVAISKTTSKWKIAALPLAICLKVIGLEVSLLIFIITAIMFVLETLSLNTVTTISDVIRGREQSDQEKLFKKRPFAYKIFGTKTPIQQEKRELRQKIKEAKLELQASTLGLALRSRRRGRKAEGQKL